MNESRRKFIGDSAKIAAGVGIAATVMPLTSSCGPKAYDKVVVGLVGCKGMGFANLRQFLANDNVECAALADVDKNVLEQRGKDVEKIHAEKAANGHKVTMKKPLLFEDYRDLLEQKDINVVICGTPDHWHTLIAIHAMQADKHLYLEKPMANTINEAYLIEEAAKKYNSIVQIGQWQRSDPHWNDAAAFVQSGQLGSVRLVRTWAYMNWFSVKAYKDTPVPDGVNYNMWLGPAPKEKIFNPARFHFNWRWWWNYGGGLMTDWGVHLNDFALAGMQAEEPNSVMSGGGIYSNSKKGMTVPDTQQAIYEFDNFNMIWEHAIGLDKGPFGKDHGVAFYGDNGTLQVDRGGWEVIPVIENGTKKPKMEAIPRISGVNKGLENHVKNFLQCVKEGRQDTNANPAIGRNVAVVSQMGNVAFRIGEKLHWDAENRKFNNDKANALMSPVYREPYKLPVL